MDVAHPYLALLPRVPAATLLALRRTIAPMTGREVARRAGVSQPAALAALDHFVEHGLVHSQPAGRANLYSLNEEHLLVSAVDAIFEAREALVKRIGAAVSHWEILPLHLSLFGSVSRGDGDANSDIDLLVVRPHFVDDVSEDLVWHGQLDSMVHEIRLWTGNRAAPVDVSSQELRTMYHQRHRLISDIRRDGLRVWGDTFDKVLLDKPDRARQGAATR